MLQILENIQIDWISFFFGLGSILILWFALLYFIYRLKKKESPISDRALSGVTQLINIVFAYILLQYLLNRLPLPDTWETYGSSVLKILIILGFFSLCIRIVNDFIDQTSKARDDRGKASSILKNCAAIILWTIAFTMILHGAGISITPLLTAMGVGGIAVALAIQAPLANLFSGIQILTTRQIRPGDYIKLSTGEEGTILDITWRATVIQTRGELTVIVPNNTVASSTITNNSWPRQAYFTSISVQVGYESDLAKVQKIATEVAKEVSMEVSKSEPLASQSVARFTAFGDSGITLSISVKAKNYTETSILTDTLIQRIHRRFQKEGISIPYPIRQLVGSDGTTPIQVVTEKSPAPESQENNAKK